MIEKSVTLHDAQEEILLCRPERLPDAAGVLYCREQAVGAGQSLGRTGEMVRPVALETAIFRNPFYPSRTPKRSRRRTFCADQSARGSGRISRRAPPCRRQAGGAGASCGGFCGDRWRPEVRAVDYTGRLTWLRPLRALSAERENHTCGKRINAKAHGRQSYSSNVQ